MRKARLFALLMAGIASTAWAASDEQPPASGVTIASRATPIAATELTALEHPWGIERLPDDGFLITEKPGRLRIWREGALSAPITGVPAVDFAGQGGLLDVALDPDFAANGIIYLAYSEAAEQQPGGRDVADPRLGVFQDLDDGVVKGLAVARARLDGARLAEVRVIWRAEKTVGRGHFGGRLAFAPDGALLIASGDRQRFEPAQDLASDLGKILRIDPATGAPMPGNPFSRERASADVWSYGHRNPLGITRRPGTEEIWVAEMGPQNGDELNLIRGGGNFGWPLESAGDNYNQTPLPRKAVADTIAPQQSFPLAISPATILFYDGELFAPWRGNVLVGALNRPGILRGVPAADGVHDLEHIETGFRVRDIAIDSDGSLLALKDGADGALIRLVPAGR
ncbi:PQQ-dependent sugar dehydrogenase [Qipengyuania qiaonensis]|uniref:PQQ-dependent sugar dehydrogenase n=1 Tax=Qipengyuania qiaonensis TaxID=2867240 RepID=A0ABS7J314_9SPHN|nr:PQQ-dependent sugar dehydrogenase [Qipengyuania qiaonensis]MBX7481715.1 PQQ-dependent sugar dehydrogenase [Qipengyuania qiaonensis]